jgi:alanyl-tRNA synthetase
VRILHEGSIGAGMRRVEAVVGPDAIREINLERELLHAVAEALGTDPQRAAERARQLVERVKRLESEQGKRAKAQQQEQAGSIADRARNVEGVRLVVETLDAGADELRLLAQDVANRLDGSDGAAVVLGSGQGGKALLVAASSRRLVERGVAAADLLAPAATIVDGGAGGKPGLAFSGGPKGDRLPDALAAIEPRLKELLANGG